MGIVFFVYRLRFGDPSFGHGPGQLWRRCASFWSPAAIAALAFLWQVEYLDGWSPFLARGMERAGLQPATSWSWGSFASYYFSRMIPYQLGPGANLILLAAGVGLLIVPVWAGVSRVCEYDKHARLWAIGGLSLVPCMLQILAFLNHSGHDFSALKLAIPLAVVPFSLLPGSLARLAARKSGNTTALAGVPVVLCLIFLWHSHGGGLEMCQGSPPSPRLAILGRLFAEKKIDHNDLVVSTNLEIPENPPQLLATTMKRVYLIKSVAELDRLMGRASFPYRLVLLRYQENASRWEFCDIRDEHQRIAARAAWARFVESPITGATGTRETPQ